MSGDSLGMVKFWDSRTCTQLQSFQGHGADVLCLAIGPVRPRLTSVPPPLFSMIDCRRATLFLPLAWTRKLPFSPW